MWHTVIQRKIVDILMGKNRYEQRIQWYDKVFIATNAKNLRSKDAVARVALRHVFGIELVRWNEWSSVQTKVFEKSEQQPLVNGRIYQTYLTFLLTMLILVAPSSVLSNTLPSRTEPLLVRVKNVLKVATNNCLQDNYLQ